MLAGDADSVRRLGALTSAPAVYPAEGFAASDGQRPLFYEGLPFQGKPTRIFAWYGAPAARAGKVPGVVLVHGGGGTAFPEWVKKWNGHGYAAISIAVEGQTSERDTGTAWKRHAWAGPARDGIYADSALPIEEQWMYHAAGAAVLANSLIRSFPEVDPKRVGIAGISWGGVITSTVIGIDTRFAFAVPIYGCGSLADAENQWGRALGSNGVYRTVWDPLRWLPNAKMPVLWLTWLYDNHFPLTSQRPSYQAAGGRRMVAVLPDMKHSHPAGWNPPDSYAFADSIVKTRKPWLRQEGPHRFRSEKPVDRAELFWTSESGYTGTRKWNRVPAKLTQRGRKVTVDADVPSEATGWFVNLHAGALTASSEFVGR